MAHGIDALQRRFGAVLLQPQALPQHLLHGLAGRAVVAGHGFQLAAGFAQAVFQCVGGVQQGRYGVSALAAAAPDGDGGGHGKCGDAQENQGEFHPGSLAQPRLALQIPGRRGAVPRPQPAAAGLTRTGALLNIPRLMSADVPEVLDAWRMVAARREFAGRLPLASLQRLQGSLVDTVGEVSYALEFDQDALKQPYAELRIDAELPLECQRTLQRFLFPVQLVQRLGLIRDEAEEAGLPEGYEPLLVPADGQLSPVELVEDELILALPTVPVKPGTEAVEGDWRASEEERQRANPFAALAGLKRGE
jgi:uncharacterized protein